MPPRSPFTDAQWRSVAESLHLSKRQLDVLKSLFQGAAEKEISSRLSISQNTVHTYLKRLHSKLGVHSRFELMTSTRRTTRCCCLWASSAPSVRRAWNSTAAS